MEGRWTLLVDNEHDALLGIASDASPKRAARMVRRVPVVPCDDAAFDRLRTRIYECDDEVRSWEHAHELAQEYIAALRAAGETP